MVPIPVNAFTPGPTNIKPKIRITGKWYDTPDYPGKWVIYGQIIIKNSKKDLARITDLEGQVYARMHRRTRPKWRKITDLNYYGASSFWIEPGQKKVINFKIVLDDDPFVKSYRINVEMTLENARHGPKTYTKRLSFKL